LAAYQQLKHQCINNILLTLNQKHSTIPATKKKINSTPAETTTVSTPYSIHKGWKKQKWQHLQSIQSSPASAACNLQVFLAQDQGPDLCCEEGGRRGTEAGSFLFDLNTLHSKSGVVQTEPQHLSLIPYYG